MGEYRRPSWDEYFMEVCDAIARRATCDRGRSGEIREFPEDVWGSGHEKGHGGLERRVVRVVTDIGLLERKEVKSSIQYKSYRGKVGEELEEHDQYYISSGDFCAEE